ncbi:hypothetical protein CB1_000466014 [Camelus ferus]|nr:hypothetical protein CB1_000466014 [Camelus ferus]
MAPAGKVTKPLQAVFSKHNCVLSAVLRQDTESYGSGMRPPPNSLGPAMPGINMAALFVLLVRFLMWLPNHPLCQTLMVGCAMLDTTRVSSSGSLWFPMGPGSDGPMGGMGGMEPHHMNGSLGSGDIDGLPKNSPNNISGISNPPGTPRDDGELGGNFLHSFQNDNTVQSPPFPTAAWC